MSSRTSLLCSFVFNPWYDAASNDEEKKKHYGLVHLKKWKRPLILGSSSPRRAELLAKAGYDVTLFPPTIDDGVYACGSMDIDEWVTTLASLKAHSVLSNSAIERGTVLAADTVCVVDGVVLGQPGDDVEAKKMLGSMIHRSHLVYTGWYLVAAEKEQSAWGCEIVSVSFGQVDDDEIDRYISTQLWKGKAGAYNLAERLDAGWPIICHGDPTSVMGLPMERLQQELSWINTT